MFKPEFVKQWLWWSVVVVLVLIHGVLFALNGLNSVYGFSSAKIATSSMALRAEMIAVVRPWELEFKKQQQLHESLMTATVQGGEGLSSVIENAQQVVRNEVTQPELCMRWGPLLSEQKNRVIDALAQWQGTWREVSRRSPVGYIVYLPQALVQQGIGLEKLTQLGIVDAFLMVESGPLQGAISLGMFRLESRALIHQQEMERRGLSGVVIQPRLGPPRTYVELIGVEQDMQALQAIYRLNPQSKLVDCAQDY